MTTIFWLGGAGDSTFLPDLIGPVKGEHHLVRVPYPGSIGPVNLTPNPLDWTEGLDESRLIGKAMLAEAIRKTSDVPWIAGYSLGAYVVSDFLDEMSVGKHSDLYVHGAITVGNPRRTTGGIAGAHKVWHANTGHTDNFHHLELAAPNDVIANCPPNSSLRKIPYFVEAITGLGKTDAMKFMSLIVTGTFAPHWRLTPRDLDLCWRYIDQTGHSRDYFKDPRHRAAIKHVLS